MVSTGNPLNIVKFYTALKTNVFDRTYVNTPKKTLGYPSSDVIILYKLIIHRNWCYLIIVNFILKFLIFNNQD